MILATSTNEIEEHQEEMVNKLLDEKENEEFQEFPYQPIPERNENEPEDDFEGELNDEHEADNKF